LRKKYSTEKSINKQSSLVRNRRLCFHQVDEKLDISEIGRRLLELSKHHIASALNKIRQLFDLHEINPVKKSNKTCCAVATN